MSFRNLIETLADGALRLPILEMATERKNIVAKARDLQHEIDEIEKNVKKTYVLVCALIAKNDFDLIQEIM